jgi:hypothetical protein
MTDSFDFDAYLRLPRLSGLRASPDGTRLIVTVGRPAPDGKRCTARCGSSIRPATHDRGG